MIQAPGIEWQQAKILALAVLFGVSGSMVSVGSHAQEDCWRQPVGASWRFPEFSFATWSDTDQSRAVLVDLFDRRSLDLKLNRDPDSGAITAQPDFSASRSSDLFPDAPVVDGGEQVAELIYGIKRTNGGFVGLNLNANNGIPSAVQWYDTNLRKRESTELLSRLGMEGELIEDNRVLSLWDWQPVADQFFAYGALGIAGRLDAVQEGFFITQLRTPGNGNATPMARMVSTLAGHRHYAFHHEFIAVDGDIAYFLEMSSYPSLLYYDTRNDAYGRLEGFPGSDTILGYPPLASIDGMYSSIETMTTPVGLYASGQGSLIALLRQPEGGGVTSWRAVKLRPDLDSGRVITQGHVYLPTQRAARHLYFLPGETTWLVLELDAMQPRAKKHRLLAALTIPHRWIAEPSTSPIAELPTARGRTSLKIGCQ